MSDEPAEEFPQIVTVSDYETWSGVLGRRLREFNSQKIGQHPEGQSIWLNALDSSGELVGGFRGDVFFNWLWVHVLFVEEGVRGKGLGRRMLSKGEALGKQSGATRARLDTFEWQAPEFYRQNGYEEILVIPNYFRGQASHLFMKELQ